jgi:hypothetical protein
MKEHYDNNEHQIKMNILIEQQEMNLFSLLRPRVTIDGNKYCILYGENLQDGICGFGDTVMLAIYDFNKNFFTLLPKS